MLITVFLQCLVGVERLYLKVFCLACLPLTWFSAQEKQASFGIYIVCAHLAYPLLLLSSKPVLYNSKRKSRKLMTVFSLEWKVSQSVSFFNIINVQQGCGATGTLIHCQWECKMVLPLWKIVWQFLSKYTLTIRSSCHTPWHLPK